MRRNQWILTVLVCILLVVNALFILIIQISRSESNDMGVGGNVISGLKGYDQLLIFDKTILTKPNVFTKKTTTVPTTTTAVSTTTSTKESLTKINTPKIPFIKTQPNINIKTVTGDNGFSMKVDYDKKIITIDNREIPFIIDPVIGTDGKPITSTKAPPQKSATSAEGWHQLSYDRFDVYIEDNYYNANTAALNDFFDKFEPRYELMENTTGWSSEEYYGVKLKIYVESTPECWGGYALPGEAHLYLSNPLYTGCQRAYYTSNPGSGEYGVNPGELGDNWFYMSGAIHESLHSINPLPVYYRLWLTEGFSEYNMYNVLENYGDINKATVDYYIYSGINGYNWEDYVANDYHDTTIYNSEIQDSSGYDISAWMFSMLRDDYDLDWNKFYNLVDKNKEVMDKADSMWATSVYISDMPVIDMFGRAVGYDFNEIKDVFEYDGPSGPGWGVRNWMSRDFYPDLAVDLTSSKSGILSSQGVANINVSVSNIGGMSIDGTSVKVYRGYTLLREEPINLANGSSMSFSMDVDIIPGDYSIRAIADYGNIKLENNETNNYKSVSIRCWVDNEHCWWKKVNGITQYVCKPYSTLDNIDAGI